DAGMKVENLLTAGSYNELATEKQVNEHQADYASYKNKQRSKDAKQDRELAYLNLKQDASDRINAPNTFADDMKGNSFGITFDEVSSTNISFDGEGMYMAEGLFTEKTVEDATVVGEARDMSGNGGDKLVRLENGWFVAASKAIDYFYLHVYKPDDNDNWSWSQLCYYYHTNFDRNDIALAADGTNVHLIHGYSTSNIYYRVIDVLNQTNIDISSTIVDSVLDTTQSALGNVSIIRNGTDLHTTWSSRNSTYSNSINIRYKKGIINADGTVTWGEVEQVTKVNTSGIDIQDPSIGIANSEVFIITQRKQNNPNSILIFKRTGLRTSSAYNWSYEYVYHGGPYPQSSPCARFVPSEINGLEQGRIGVVWRGRDSTDTSADNIRFSYSDDIGETWSSVEKVTSGNTSNQLQPNLTANKQGEFIALWAGYDNSYANIKKARRVESWGVVTVVTNNTTGHALRPSSLFDLSIEISEPLFVYQDIENDKVGFYGTWMEGSESPTTSATAVYTLDSTDYVGAFVQKQGDVNIDAYINDVLMDSELEDDEYQFVKPLNNEEPITLRLELSRATTDNGDSDKVTRILGGIA
ncbi:hypothetical protein SAMN05216389_1434, partial [Oceanobacillus limi]